jgi:hypothetical protein
MFYSVDQDQGEVVWWKNPDNENLETKAPKE